MKKLSIFTLALIVLLLLAVPVAFAQGTTGDKVVLGEDYVLRQGESLDGNLAVLGGTAEIENGAIVRGDVSVLGGALTVDGVVTGNVSILGGSVQLNESAEVDGNLANLSGSINRAPGATVRGDTFNGLRAPSRAIPAPITPGTSFRQESPRSWFGRFINWQLGTIGSILLMGLLGLVLVVVAPRAVGRVASAVAVQPGLTFVFGFLTLILGLLAGAILLIACGLGLLVWLALAAASVLGWVGVSLWVGQRLLTALKMRSASSIAEVLVGVVVITFFGRIPCIGWLVGLIFGSWGLGAVVMTRFGTQDAEGPARSRPAPLVPPLAPSGGTGGDFMPRPEATDLELATPPVVPPIAPTPPEAPVVPSAETSAALTDISGIDVVFAERLQAAGINTVQDLAGANPVELAEATGVTVGQIMLEDWIGQAQRLA